MKTERRLWLTGMMLVSLIACDTYFNVTSDYDRSVNFAKYKTFAWLPDVDTTNNEFNNQIIRNNTRTYVNTELAEQGYRISVDSPDVFLDLIVRNVQTENAYTTYSYNMAPGWYVCNPYYQYCPPQYYYTYPYYYGYSTNYVTERSVDGTITLNMIDRKQNKLVWTVTATGNLYDPVYAEDNLHPAVYEMVSTYPLKEMKRPKPVRE